MRKVAYTNHIGRTSRDTHSGKNTAICNLADLAAAEKHNNHDYTQEEVARMQSDINLDLKHYNSQYVMVDGQLVEVDGHIDLEANVRKIYKEQFGAAVDEYNQRQAAAGHPGRQIQSYIDKISESKQQEVAVEGLIQFGSLEDWEGKSMEEKQAVVPLLLQALRDTMGELNQEDAEFILAGASIHLNEGSPHLHYVGVPVQHAEKARNGPKVRVGKSAVFTQETLGTGLQDNVRAKIEPQLVAAFGWKFEEKQAGRNKDLTKNQIASKDLKERIQEQELVLAGINSAIGEAQDDLFTKIQSYGTAQIEEFYGNSDAFGNVEYLAVECDPDRFADLDREGWEMRKSALQGQLIEMSSPIVIGLEQTIAGIQAGRGQLTWAQRRKCFEQHGEMSSEFWPMREDIQKRYSADLQEKYQARRDAYRHYSDSTYVLLRSRSFIGVIINGIRALADVKKIQKLNQEIEELRVKQRILSRNTASFARFSREYRDDLKAGNFPGNDLLDSMARIVRQLDQERQAFLEQGDRAPNREKSSLR